MFPYSPWESAFFGSNAPFFAGGSCPGAVMGKQCLVAGSCKSELSLFFKKKGKINNPFFEQCFSFVSGEIQMKGFVCCDSIEDKEAFINRVSCSFVARVILESGSFTHLLVLL